MRLPAHAQSCAVARPGTLSERQRWLALRLMRSHRVVWLGDLDVVAAAEANAVDEVSRQTSVVVLRIAGDVQEARARLERAVPLDDERSPYGARRSRVEIVGPDTLVIRHGRWTDGLPGAEARCRELARAHPDAFEVASSAQVDPLGPPDVDMPQRVDQVIARTPSGVVVERRAFLANPASIESDFLSEFDPLVPDSRAAYWDGAARVTETRYLWQDLELAREDEERLAEADRAARAEARPRPVEQIDISNSAVVRMEVRRWEEAIAAVQGERRAAHARELRRILEAAWVAHPSQTEFASVLYSLLMTELDDAPAAATLAGDVMHAAPADEQTWRANRRAALARLGAAELAPVLVEDGLVRANESGRAAGDILEILSQRENYDLAESAWLATRVFESTLAQAPLVPVRAAEIGRKALVPTAVALVLAGREPTGLEGLYVLARGRANPAWSPAGSDDTAAVARLDRGDRVLVVGADVAEVDASTARLSRQALQALAPGPVTIGIFFVPFHSQDNRASARVLLAGTLDERGLTIERAAWGGARVAWERVSQYVAGPLESFEPDQVFPPVEVTLNAEGTRELELVLDARDAVPDVTCRAIELRVDCSAAAGPDALYGFIAEVAARVLTDDARLILR